MYTEHSPEEVAELILAQIVETLRSGALDNNQGKPDLICDCQRTVERAGWPVQTDEGRLLADTLCERYDDPADKADVEKVIELATELDVWPDTPGDLLV